MLRSYLLLALRTLQRRRSFTAVNSVGLTVGLACCALVAVFLEYELSYDTHHEDADRIYRIVTDYRSSTYSTISFRQYRGTPADEQRVLAERLPEAIPAVEQATNVEILRGPAYVTADDGTQFTTQRRLLTNTGPAFADLFTFERIAGDPLKETLRQPYSAVLTSSTAERIFGSAPAAVGQSLTLDSLDTTVRAVVADPPSNSRIAFELAVQVKRIPNWGAYHYLRLAKGTDPAAVVPQVSRVMDEADPRRVEDDTRRQNLNGDTLQSLTDIHLADRALYDDTPHRNPAYLWAFGAIGFLILVITTINYANLSLALYAERGSEIGVRKALGGHRTQIARQFLVEATLLAVACVPLAMAACAAVLPAFNTLMETSIDPGRFLNPLMWSVLLMLALGAGLVAGGYPALVLAKRRTVDLFDRALSSGQRRGGWSLRHGLIVLQFAVLIGLGSLSWIAYDQLRYMQDGDLGFQREGIVRLASFSTRDSTEYLHLQRRLLQSSAIEAVGTGVTPNPGTNRANVSTPRFDGVYRDFYSEIVDVGWFDAMGVSHPVIDAMRDDGLSAPQRVLINQAAVERFGFDAPVGKEIIIGPNYDEPIRLTVDGVLPNMHLRPMREPINPTIFRVRPTRQYVRGAVVRMAPGRMDDGMQHVRTVWADLRPDTPLQPVFMDEQVAALYEQEARFSTLSAVLAGLAILLAAIGLASLVAYLTRLRMKEIGVRKSLGASVPSLVALMNKEYVRLVGIAFVVGTPLAWWAAHAWLSQFAYRVDLSAMTFLGTGLGALIVAVAAVSVQALRAARVDPARVLRSE